MSKSALQAAAGTNDPATLKALMDGVPGSNGTRINGMWDIVSENLAKSANGDVRTLTAFADGGKTFAATELPALMANPNVTSINGVSKAVYQQVYETALTKGGVGAAQEALLSSVKFTSASVSEGVTYGLIDGQMRVGTGGLLEGTGAAKQTLPPDLPDFKSVSSELATLPDHSAFKDGAMALGEAMVGNPTANIGMKVLTTGGGALAAAATAYTAYEIKSALDAGDTAKANDLARGLISGWSGGLAASVAAGSVAAQVLAPLLAGGPVGGVIYTVLVGASALVGGYWGAEAVNGLLSKLDMDLFSSSLNSYRDPTDPYMVITDLGNGMRLRQESSGYIDSEGLLHVLITMNGPKSSSLQNPCKPYWALV